MNDPGSAGRTSSDPSFHRHEDSAGKRRNRRSVAAILRSSAPSSARSAAISGDVAVHSIGARRLRLRPSIQFPKPRTICTDDAKFMTSIPFDRDHDPALDRRRRLTEQTMVVYRALSRRCEQPPYDGRRGAAFRLR